MSEQPSARLAQDVADNTVLPFTVEALDVRGRLVRLGAVLDDVLTRHAYPLPVSQLLAQAVALTCLLGTALKFEGRFMLQTSSDGVVPMLVVDFEAPDRVRAYASFDSDRLEAAVLLGKTAAHELLGHGHLALTVDQGAGMNRYQGLVALDGASLEEVAHDYFMRSEQIPTLIRLSVAPSVATSDGLIQSGWRAGGLLLQYLPASGGQTSWGTVQDFDGGDGSSISMEMQEENWMQARALAATVEDEELLDPDLSPEALLYRLFHEQGVRVFTPQPLCAFCRCSRERVASVLESFSDEEKAGLEHPDVAVHVSCEFCSRSYTLFASEVGGYSPIPPRGAPPLGR